MGPLAGPGTARYVATPVGLTALPGTSMCDRVARKVAPSRAIPMGGSAWVAGGRSFEAVTGP
jgi:hypothetical protein